MSGRGSSRGIVVGSATGRLLGGLSLRQGTQGCVYGEGEVEVVFVQTPLSVPDDIVAVAAEKEARDEGAM